MNTRYVNLYLKHDGEIIVGELKSKEASCLKEEYGTYKKIATVTVYLTDETLDLIDNR